MKTYASVQELKADNPDKWLSVGNEVVQGGEGTHWQPNGRSYWSQWVDGRIVPQNWQPENDMDPRVKLAGWLRAKGAEMVPIYREIVAELPNVSEAELLAAEDSMRAPGVPSAGPPPPPTVVTQLVVAKGIASAIPSIDVSGWRIDAVVPAGTPGTITMPKTGHVLSLPSNDPEENLMGYATRVMNQATGGQGTKYAATIATILIGGAGTATADRSSWPEAVDRMFNLRSYMTDAERAQADAAWAGYTMQRPATKAPASSSGSSDPNVDA